MRPEFSSTVALARRRVEKLRLTHARLAGVRESACTREAELAVKVSHAKARLALGDEVNETLEALQNRAHQRAVGAFERLLTAILEDVLPGKGAVKFALGTERGAPALDVQIDNAGELEDALNGSGGAVTNVLSAGLRFAALSRTNNRKFVVLDEPDCWLKPERVPAFIRVLAEVAEKARTQTVLISHHEPSTFEGLVNIVRLAKGADGTVQAQVMEPHDGTMWLDDEEPGIRSIRLINFRAHADTTLPLFPGVTALIGDNDLGKSTLAVSAMRAVAYGEADDTLIRHGATEARVQVRLERGRMVEWVRRAKGNPRVTYALYENGKLVHEGRPNGRGQVPEWVTEVLGIARVDDLDIQLGSQKAPVFLLDEKASTRARLLSVGRESGRLHALIDAYAELKRKDREQVREGEAEIAELRRRIEASHAIPSLAAPLEELAVRAAEIESLAARQVQLEKFLARIDAIELRRAQLEARLRVLESVPALPKLEETKALENLIGTLERAGRVASLRREFPIVTVPSLFDLGRLADLTARMARAQAIVSARRELPDVQIPTLESTGRIAQLIDTMTRSQKVASLRREFPLVSVPELLDNRPLIQLGKRMTQLTKRAQLLKRLPAAPVVPECAELMPLARSIERVSARAQAKTHTEQAYAAASTAEAEAREELNSLIEAMGGVCPVCNGELRAVHEAQHTEGTV